MFSILCIPRLHMRIQGIMMMMLFVIFFVQFDVNLLPNLCKCLITNLSAPVFTLRTLSWCLSYNYIVILLLDFL